MYCLISDTMLFNVCVLLTLVRYSISAYVEVSPDPVPPVIEDDHVILTLRLYVNASDPYDTPWMSGAVVTVTTENDQVFVDNSTFLLLPDRNVSLVATVKKFGYDWLIFNVTAIRNNISLDRDNLNVSLSQNVSKHFSFSVKLRLLRRESAFDTIFLVCISVFVIINNINMGCILDLKVLKSVFKKPVGPIVGFLSQFLFMPLASYGVALGLLDSPSIQLGLFTLGCCPGGTGSNFWTFLFRGDVNLSVVMTFISTVAALGMMPLWLFTLGQEFFQDDGVLSVPYEQLLITLVSFGIPVGIGCIIRYCRPNWAKASEKIIRPYTIILLIFFLTIGVYTNWYIILLMTWQIVLSGVIVAWGGYLFGALAACCFCMNRDQVVAISIETALQNPGVAFILLKISLPQPEADFASVSPAAQLMVTGIPLWIMYIVYCCKRRKENKRRKLRARETKRNGPTDAKVRPWEKCHLDKEAVHPSNEPSATDPLRPRTDRPKKPIGLSTELWISAPQPLITDFPYNEHVSESVCKENGDNYALKDLKVSTL